MSYRVIQEPCRLTAALSTARFRHDVLVGLSQPEKTIPCKYLYDERGSGLFEAICKLDEYYPTRTELSILRQNIDEIASLLGPGANVIDLGSGSGIKTRLLLDHLEGPASCRPVDVSRTQLLECSARLARDYPRLLVEPLCADYTRPFNLPPTPLGSGEIIVFFPGSTIGNFEPREALQFLQRIARVCGVDGGLLIGVDLKKSPAFLNAAYNDSLGVTAEFNLNLLVRMNRELHAGFDIKAFEHRAIYNAAAGRIEMHLLSRRAQTVPVNSHEFSFAMGESIVTEHCYKYSLGEFRRLAADAGFEVTHLWLDRRHWFSVQYLRPVGGKTAYARQQRKRALLLRRAQYFRKDP